jgi:hypothetical protein
MCGLDYIHSLRSHPERARIFAREESRESKDPYKLERPLHRGICVAGSGAKAASDELIGVLRLRSCFAPRSRHSAQDDSDGYFNPSTT